MAKKIKDLADLQHDIRNANRGTQRGRGMVEASLREVGAGRSIVTDKDGRVIAGNKTLEAAADIGLKIKVVETTGEELVVVQRNDLDLSDDTGPARKLAYYDNRAGEVGLAWDAEVLLADLQNGVDLAAMFQQDELDALLNGLVDKAPVQDAGAQVDKAAELQAKWQTQTGQLWQCGKHKIICGDSTDKAVIDRLLQGEKPVLMVTDPPYGVEYDPEWRNEAAEKGLISYAASSIGKVMNDDRVDWTETYRNVDAQVVYVWHADRHAKEVQSNLESIGYQMVSQIIWAKPVFAISRGDYHWQHEPCWYAVKKGKKHNWQGSRSESTLWEIERGIPDKSGHGTEKPLECMARPVRNNTAVGEIVCDPFLGSGTTLLACEDLNRQCRGVELNPSYVAIALQRYQDSTGIEPKLIDSYTDSNRQNGR